MRARGLITESVGNVAQAEGAVYHRVQPDRIDRTHEIHLVAPAAHDEALQARLFGHQRAGRDVAGAPGQHADQRDMAAHAHRGASFVEIYQNCIVYNDDVFASFTEKQAATEKQLWLQPGEKMLFAGGTKGLALDSDRLCLKVVAGDDPSVITHDPTNRQVAAMLILMPNEGFPVALGVIYEDPRPTFESAVIEQNKAAASGKKADLQALVSKGQTWQVEKEPHQL